MVAKGERHTFGGAEPLGSGNSALIPGTSVRVRGVHPPNTKGAGGTGANIVVEWEVPSIVKTDKGNEIGTALRAMSIPATEFSSIFTKES